MPRVHVLKKACSLGKGFSALRPALLSPGFFYITFLSLSLIYTKGTELCLKDIFIFLIPSMKPGLHFPVCFYALNCTMKCSTLGLFEITK